jgi:hypothetical protein
MSGAVKFALVATRFIGFSARHASASDSSSTEVARSYTLSPLKSRASLVSRQRWRSLRSSNSYLDVAALSRARITSVMAKCRHRLAAQGRLPASCQPLATREPGLKMTLIAGPD